jgi:hypothetical protein
MADAGKASSRGGKADDVSGKYPRSLHIRAQFSRMAKTTPAKKSKSDAKPAKNANPKGAKITPKSVRATKHKAPERRNENKVRGR